MKKYRSICLSSLSKCCWVLPKSLYSRYFLGVTERKASFPLNQLVHVSVPSSNLNFCRLLDIKKMKLSLYSVVTFCCILQQRDTKSNRCVSNENKTKNPWSAEVPVYIHFSWRHKTVKTAETVEYELYLENLKRKMKTCSK